jgi:hypothetical protein
MGKLVVSAPRAELTRSTAANPATGLVAAFSVVPVPVVPSSSRPGAFDSSHEDGDGKSSWNTRAY